MRGFLYAFCVISVIALAFWAYRENHVTQQSMAEVRGLKREIAGLQQALSVQRAEWAYLSRPERLQQLVDLNFERLALLPMLGDQFGSIDEVVYPEMSVPDLTIGSVDVFGPVETLSGSDVDARDVTVDADTQPPAFQGLRPPEGGADLTEDPDPYIRPMVLDDAGETGPSDTRTVAENPQTQEQFP